MATKRHELSERDKRIIEALCGGTKQEIVAEQYKITQQRVSLIWRSPGAIEYMTARIASPKRILVHNLAIDMLYEMLLECKASGYRLKAADLISIIKVLPPPAIDVSTTDMLESEVDAMIEAGKLTEADRPKMIEFIRRETAGIAV